MKKIRKRILSIVLTCVMVVSLLADMAPMEVGAASSSLEITNYVGAGCEGCVAFFYDGYIEKAVSLADCSSTQLDEYEEVKIYLYAKNTSGYKLAGIDGFTVNNNGDEKKFTKVYISDIINGYDDGDMRECMENMNIPVDSVVENLAYECDITQWYETFDSLSLTIYGGIVENENVVPDFSIRNIDDDDREFFYHKIDDGTNNGMDRHLINAYVDTTSANCSCTWQWYRDNVAIEGATGETYQIPEELDVGTYTYYCKVIMKNSAGEQWEKDSNSVTVIIKPDENDTGETITITTQPSDYLSFKEGEVNGELSVEATVSNGGVLTYQWYVSGEAIEGATGATYSLPTDLQAGSYNYTCEISAEGAASVTTDGSIVSVCEVVKSLESWLAVDVNGIYTITPAEGVEEYYVSTTADVDTMNEKIGGEVTSDNYVTIDDAYTRCTGIKRGFVQTGDTLVICTVDKNKPYDYGPANSYALTGVYGHTVELPHVHNLKYFKYSDNIIEIICDTSNCINPGYLTITADDADFKEGMTYTGARLNANQVANWEQYDVPIPEIKYYKDEACTQEVTEFTEAGTYYAAISCTWTNGSDTVTVKDAFTLSVHEHELEYSSSSSGKTMCVVCNAGDCIYYENLTITAKDADFKEGMTYTGASLDANQVATWEQYNVPIPEIKYYKDEACTEEVTEFTEAGTYYAAITCTNTDGSNTVTVKDDFTLKVHNHYWKYFGDENVLEVICDGEGRCPVQGSHYLTITAEAVSGNKGMVCKGATIDEDEKEEWESMGITIPEIKYYSDAACTQEVTTFTETGTYYAAVSATGGNGTVGTAKVAFTVTVTESPSVHTHSLTLVPAKAATCTADGNKAYYTCSGCDSLFADANGTTITTAEAVKVAALDHDWTGEWTIIKEATETEDGKKETLCTRGCGQKKVAIIPATGTTDDNGNLEKDVEIATDAPIDEATLNNSKEELLEADNIFTDAEKTQIANGTDASVWIEISKTDESAIASTDKAKIEQEAAKIMGNNPTITYFDVDLFKQVGSGAKQEITEPGIAMKITIVIPDELLNTDKKVSREYKIIRLHEGQVDGINGTFDSTTGEFTFETDKFSTYAIVYKDVPVNDDDNSTPEDDDDNSTPEDDDDKSTPEDDDDNSTPEDTDVIKPENEKKDEVPKTGDSNTTLYSFILMLLSGFGIIICSRKKKVLNKES